MLASKSWARGRCTASQEERLRLATAQLDWLATAGIHGVPSEQAHGGEGGLKRPQLMEWLKVIPMTPATSRYVPGSGTASGVVADMGTSFTH